MKLIISENQYRRLLEKKNLNLLNEYQNVNFIGGIKKISPEISTILGYLSTLSDSDTDVKIINGNQIDVITDKEGIKGSLKDFLSSNQEEYKIEDEKGKLNIKYEKKKVEKIEDFFIDDGEDDSIYVEDGLYLVTPSYGNKDFGYTTKNGRKYGNGGRNRLEKLCNQGKKRYCKRHNHYGEDYVVKQGTEIYSKMSGKVLDSEIRRNNCGGTLKILMNDGTTSRFCHLSDIYVNKGEYINKNQLIALSGGKVGSNGAGSSTAPHIHYEYKDSSGTLKDPIGLEKKYWGIKR